MKKFSLILILGTACLISYSQSGKEIMFKLHQRHIVVYLSDYIGLEYLGLESSPVSYLHVKCRIRCSDLRFPKIKTRALYFVDNYRDYYDYYNDYIDNHHINKKMDFLCQNLYDWIKEIEDFAIDQNLDSITFTTKNNLSYHLVVHKSHIIIYAVSFIGGDQKGFNCVPWVKLKKKTITEFKRHLLEYTKEHNISIRL
jgi:hypothetical protein